MLLSTVRSDAQLLLRYDATQRRFGEMENQMKSIEQELNHVFHTIGSENGAWDTGEPSGGFQSVGWNWKWTAAPSPFWQPRVNKSQFPSIASHSWPQKNLYPQYSPGSRRLILGQCAEKWRKHLRPGRIQQLIWPNRYTAEPGRVGGWGDLVLNVGVFEGPTCVHKCCFIQQWIGGFLHSALASSSCRGSYKVIYGCGVSYGNTDLPFTSHQTDNRPVSCCYDSGRGPEDCNACLHALAQADGRQEQIPIGRYSESQMNFGSLELRTQPQIWPDKTPLKVRSRIFPSQTQCQDNQIFLVFFSFLENKTFIPPHLYLHFQFAYQRNPIGTCFAYLHLISNFKWTCQKWSSFLFWMCEDYLACIISASTCNVATKQNKLISNGARGTFYIAFH